ncbi:MAG TPA: ATP-binding protein, partial [Pyrinomonadaceae bacterium]|nr:ATP-binding protein [Pyrinomonadaceae bacterium]
NLWMGMHNGGLARRRPGAGGRFELFGVADGVPEGFEQGMYLDRAGRLWIATRQNGVRLEDPAAERPRIVPLTTVEQLASDNLRCFVEDEQGRVYVGNARGVDRLDLQTGRIRHFTTADGLAKSEVMAAFRDRHGALWFGTREGLSRLVPEPERAEQSPLVLIGGLRVAGVPYPVSEMGAPAVQGLVLEAGQNQIQIDFFSLDFSAGEGVRYQYKFDGAGADWSALTDQRTVTANLSPGAYRFLVRAVNAEGALSPEPASVAFQILRPVWQRWWFLSLAALVLAIVVFAFARSRVARLVELERVRTRIATDLHDDIGSSLSQIAILSEVVTQRVPESNAPVLEPVALIAGTSREMVDSMSDIVWAINPQRDHLSDLTQRMRRFASDSLNARDIGFRFRAPAAEKDIRLGADLRREVYLIFKECVNNLVKHSKCNEAELELRIVNNWIVLRISDDGEGFDPAAQTPNGNGASLGGHGLPSMRRRAEALGGTFEVKSEKGRGTVSTLKVPARHHGNWLKLDSETLLRVKEAWKKFLHK